MHATTQQTSHHHQKKNVDLVKELGVLREQVFVEEKTSKAWDKRWGFVKDVEKMCIQVAKEKGICEKEFKRRSKKLEVIKSSKESFKKLPVVPVPITQTGFVGWRSGNKDCNLEILGPLYISPKLTIDPPGMEAKPQMTGIILG